MIRLLDNWNVGLLDCEVILLTFTNWIIRILKSNNLKNLII